MPLIHFVASLFYDNLIMNYLAIGFIAKDDEESQINQHHHQ